MGIRQRGDSMLKFRTVPAAVWAALLAIPLLAIPSLANPIQATVAQANPAMAEKRVALVIGNGAYVSSGALSNPVNDARDVAAVLTGLGFEVLLGIDLEKRGFDGKVRDFAKTLAQADVALFYYAGHGLQVSGRNYLVPVDAKLETERDLDFEGVALDFVLKQMELEREGKTNIVLLDACRDNPLARNLARTMGTRSANIGQGLAQVRTGVGTFIAYSTQPGNVALDGQGRNSPFTAALTKAVKEPGRTITTVMIDVRKDVLAATAGRQVPWDHSALTGDFYFHRVAAAQPLPKPVAPGEAMDRLQKLEDELKKKSDPQQTADMVALAQYRERVRRIEEDNRADQKRIFDVQVKSSRSTDPNARTETSFEIGRIQTQIVRRGQEMKTLREDIKKLEERLGLAAQPAAAAK
jgi:uncharacterized caspase-like protein